MSLPNDLKKFIRSELRHVKKNRIGFVRWMIRVYKARQ